MIPLCLTTGFLGCGKTTFLKETVRKNRQRRIVYLVNEFSSCDVDGQLVASENADVVSVPGGSIFCKCLVTEFIGTLKRIAEEFHSEDTPVEGVVIEASGMADPRVVESMLEETGLDRWYRLAMILAIVEPRSFLRLIHTLPNIRTQVESADHVLLNKCDLYDEDTLSQTEQAVREIQPAADLIRCEYGRVDLDLFPPSVMRGLKGEYAKCRDPNYMSCALFPEKPVDADVLKRRIESIEEDLYRLKGTIRTTDGWVYFDYSKAGLETTPLDAFDGVPGLACILRGDPSPEAREFVDAFPSHGV
jgi:G3E family GTPase